MYFKIQEVGEMKDFFEEYFFEEECVYSKSGRDALLDEDELSPEEEAFMRGYEEAA